MRQIAIAIAALAASSGVACADSFAPYPAYPDFLVLGAQSDYCQNDECAIPNSGDKGNVDLHAFGRSPGWNTIPAKPVKVKKPKAKKTGK
jgi:hypothetical protein